MGVYFTTAGMAFLLGRAMAGFSVVNFTGDTTTSSATVASVSSTAGLFVGMSVSGTGIPAGAYIIAIGTTTITLSVAATATGTAVALQAGGTPAQELDLTLHLITGTVVQGPAVQWSDLTEATYDGYAAVTLPSMLTTIFSPETGYVTVSAPCQVFQPSDSIVSNTITGLAWTFPGTGTSGPQLIATEALADPVNLNSPLTALQLIPVLDVALDNTAGPGSAIL